MAEIDGGSISKLEYDSEIDKIIDKETGRDWEPEWKPPDKPPVEWSPPEHDDWRPPKPPIVHEGGGGNVLYGVQEKGGYGYSPNISYSPNAPSGYNPNPPKGYIPGAETKVQTNVLNTIKAQAPLLVDEFGLGKLGVAVMKNIGDASMMKKGVPLDVNAMAKWDQATIDMVVGAALHDILNNPLQMGYLEKWNQDDYITNLPNMGPSHLSDKWSPGPADFIRQGIYMPWRGWSGMPLFDPTPPNPRLLGGFSGPVAYLPNAPNPYVRTSYGFNWLPRYLRRI